MNAIHIVIELAFIEITLFRAEYIHTLFALIASCPCHVIHRAVVRGGAGAPEFGVSKKRTALGFLLLVIGQSETLTRME